MNTGSSSEYGFKDHPAAEDGGARAEQLLRGHQGLRHPPLPPCGAALDGCESRPCASTRSTGPGRTRPPVPALIVHGLRGLLPPLTSPETARDYVYVDDVVDAFLLAAAAGGRTRRHLQRRHGRPDVAATRWSSRAGARHRRRPRLGLDAGRAWDTAVWVADPRRFSASSAGAPRAQLLKASRARWRGCALTTSSAVCTSCGWGTPGRADDEPARCRPRTYPSRAGVPCFPISPTYTMRAAAAGEMICIK